MMRLEDMAFSAAPSSVRMGERWQASAAGVKIPAPEIAASMLRSVWRKAAGWDVWPASMSLATRPGT